MIGILKSEEYGNLKFEYNEHSLIVLGDSLELLSKMKDKSIDLIFADPPYNLGKDFGNDSDSWECKKTYLDWCYKWIDESFRVLKDGGSFYIMNSTQNMPFINVYLEENYNIVNNIVWAYDSSGVQSKKKFGSLFEPITFATKSKKSKYTFNWKDILVEAKTGAKRKLIDYRKNPPQPYNAEKVPGNVWEFPRVRYKMNEYENHPSQKPEKLLERIIKSSSNEGDVVFDPFGGSFSTAAVAVQLGRKAISVDLNEEYFKIGLRRTQITDMYDGNLLEKDKSRKTKNRSKKDHLKMTSENDNQIEFVIN